MSLSTIPPKFTTLRKRYNIDIKVLNSGALQRNRGHTPKKAKATSTAEAVQAISPPTWPDDESVVNPATDAFSSPAYYGSEQAP
jgi:hypothetical protein